MARRQPEVCRQADIPVAAVGRPRVITGEMVQEGAVVIDVGINQNKGIKCLDAQS